MTTACVEHFLSRRIVKPICLARISVLLLVLSSCRAGMTEIPVVPPEPALVEGTGTVEGYVGYFSPALPPEDSEIPPLPSGYAFSSYRWIKGSPGVSFGQLYLLGRESDLKNAIYVRASGTWKLKSCGPSGSGDNYVELTVSRLQTVFQR